MSYRGSSARNVVAPSSQVGFSVHNSDGVVGREVERPSVSGARINCDGSAISSPGLSPTCDANRGYLAVSDAQQI